MNLFKSNLRLVFNMKSYLAVAFILLQMGNSLGATSTPLSTVEMNDGKLRVQYRIKNDGNIKDSLKSFHHLLLKAGFERHLNDEYGVSTLLSNPNLTIETFLYHDEKSAEGVQGGALVVSISVEGKGKSFFADEILDLQGSVADPLLDLVRNYGSEIEIRSGVIAYDFENIRCFPRRLNMDFDIDSRKGANCFIFIR